MSYQPSPLRRGYKQAKRTVRNAAGVVSDRIAATMPAGVRRVLGPPYRHMQMLLLDVGFLRIVYPNRHKIAPNMWRSAQPLPHHIRAFGRQNIRTIINLRGVHTSPTYRIEREACRSNNIDLIDFKVNSRAAPTKEELFRIRDLFDRITYPAVMHCKSGSDRAGLMSVLYLHLKEGMPIEQARRQLGLRFGHIRHASPGVLSAFLDRYISDTESQEQDFFDWVDTRYDPEDLQAQFRAKGWANRLVDDVFGRE